MHVKETKGDGGMASGILRETARFALVAAVIFLGIFLYFVFA